MDSNANDEHDDEFPLDMTDAEFAEWIKHPQNQRKLQNHIKNVLGGEYSGSTPEMIESAKFALAKLRETKLIESVQGKVIQLAELMRQATVRSPREVLEESKVLMEEVTDAMLDVPEPKRTVFMKVLLPIREQLRNIKD
jgi:hypothetical protein